MCLLIKKPAATRFDKEDILDFYQRNKDGVGIMFAEGGTLHVQKVLPNTAEDAWEFYKDFADKECVIHFRMQTHGDIDMENCHPYKVFGEGEADAPVYMAHNGVLSTGNAADKSKSDTWHYINDIIRPCAQGSSDILFVPAFVSLLEKHIGSTNKFIFMDADGRVSVVNKQAFVQYKGADLSNTYAWTASRGGYGPRNTYGGAYFPRHWGGFDDDDDFFGGGETVTTSHRSSPYNSKVAYTFASDLFMTLRQVQYDKAHKSLTYDEAKKYRITMGELQSNHLLEAIRGKKLTETAVMGYVRSMRAYSEATVLALPSATTGGVGAGQEYAADFFTTCQARGLMVAYKHFSVQDIVDFHEAVGEEEAQKFLDRMDSGVLTARHVIEDVEKAVLNYVLSTQAAACGGA